jgi:GNAT superfamily N-acetyltransferase
VIGTQIRAVSDGDVAAITSFISELSLRSRYLRFFTGAGPSSAVIRLLAGGSGADVLVATCDGAVVGHAIAVQDPGPPVLADVGVVVADAWQGRGVGSALLRALVARARAHGATGITMSVLPENRPVLAMISDHWPAASLHAERDSLTFRVPMAPDPVQQHGNGRDGAPAVSGASRLAGRGGQAAARRRRRVGFVAAPR